MATRLKLVLLTPVDLGIPSLGKDLLDNLGVQDLSKILADESESLLGGRFVRHVASAELEGLLG